MKVRYKSEKYDVKFKNAIGIWKRKILLYLRRLKRFGLRILHVFKKDLMILFFAIIFYVLIVIVIECKIMQKGILNAIWDTKAEVFTVFIVVAMNSIISSERSWRQKIRKWHDVYTDNLFYFEENIKDLNVAIGMNIKTTYNMLYTIETYKKFENEIRQAIIEEDKINKSKINKTLEKMERNANELKEAFYKNDFMQEKYGFTWNYRSLLDNMYDLREKLDRGEYNNIREKLILIYDDMYYMISYTRRLWRTEINLDREIIEILKIGNKEKISENFYLTALSYK